MIDYTQIPEIKAQLEWLKKCKNSENKHLKNAASILSYKKGKELQLTVKVTDTDLANIMLSSQFSGEINLPGFELQEIRFSDLERTDVIRNWLEKKLNELSV